MSIPRIPIDRIRPNTANIRTKLGDLDELAASILAVGLLQPLVVRPDGHGKFVLVDGHRRFHAARRAGLTALPCLASKAEDETGQIGVMLAAAMHKQLEPVEQAQAFTALRNRGLSVADIARRTGYSTATVSGRLLLADLPDETQEMVREGQISVTDATTLARQIRASGRGSAPVRESRPAWFAPTHRLARAVQDTCTHTDVRPVVGRSGCGPCWESAIRADERATTIGDVA